MTLGKNSALKRAAVTLTLAALATLGLGTIPLASGTDRQNQDSAWQSKSIDTAAVVGFRPGMIISDEVFYNPNTMDAGSIQSFLNAQGSACVPGTGDDGEGNLVTVPCLKDFAMPIPDVPADDYCKGDIVGSEGDTAAVIIDKVAKACSINPQALLVTLQKEQGLITASGTYLIPRRYRSAMGYGCPDTADCNAKYYGFFNQVYNAAHRFQYYRAHPKKFRHRAGRVNDMLYHPKRDEDGQYVCGTSPVFIENQATAGLYNYTPYMPNAAALTAGGGLGDECSSYGNRNFYRFFTGWFGSTGDFISRIAAVRVQGASRVETAAGIAARSFPEVSDRVYVARADNPVDALAGGILTDGPVLLVPVNGPIPQLVRDTITRLNATEVVALGGTAALSDELLADVAQGRTTQRIFGNDRVGTAVAIAHHAFGDGKRAEEVYLADALGPDGKGSPDAVVAGMLTKGPILLLDQKNAASLKLVAQEISRFAPQRVVALGGTKVLSDALLEQMAAGITTGRLAGADRYATALAVAQQVYPPRRPQTPENDGKNSDAAPTELGSTAPENDTNIPLPLSKEVLYLARGDNFADALVAGGLTDGPLVLVPACGQALPPEIAAYAATLRPNAVIALGGLRAVCPDTVDDTIAAIKAGMR